MLHSRARWPYWLAAVFCVYSAVMLWDAFRAKAQLKAAADARLIAESRRSAAALENFAARRARIALDLASIHELQTYLVNKSLGMSPQYGLNASLEALEIRLRREIDRESRRDGIRFERLVFVDLAGQPVADSGGAAAWTMPAELRPGETGLILDAARGRIISISPVLHNNAPAGALVSVSDASQLHEMLIHGEDVGSYREMLLSAAGEALHGTAQAVSISPGLSEELLRLPENLPVQLVSPSVASDPRFDDAVVIRSALPSLPAVLITAVAREQIYGHLSSSAYLYSATLFPLLVLIGALQLERLRRRARAAEQAAASSQSQRQQLQGENAALTEEIDRREVVEHQLQLSREHLEDLVSRRTVELKRLFDALPDIYFRVGRSGEILDFRSGRDTELFVKPDQFLGRTMQDLLPAAVSTQFRAGLRQITEGADRHHFEYELPMPRGREFYEARMVPLDEQRQEIVIVVRNITERRLVEEVRDANRREAERLARVKSEFLANMSHEIRTPLNGVLGMAQIGLRESSGDPRAHDTFGRILESGKLLLGVINDILDFSKIEAGKLVLESVPVRLSPLFDHACEILAERAEAKGIRLLKIKSDTLPACCLADPLRLEQVLINLLSNAVKFTDQGSVTLSAAREGASLIVRVEDTGIGIAPEHLERLFAPFEQGDSGTTRRFGGTGLGLAITARMVRLMGGEISVASQLGEGSCFELRLPLIEAQPVEAAGAAAAAAPLEPRHRLAGLTILVAEDTEINQLVIESMLTAEGARVVLAGNGRLAVEAVQNPPPSGFDLVLMDIQMPELDGYEATRRILGLAPDLPVVGQTAHAMAEERERCHAAGMVGHVAKPIDLEELVGVILICAERTAAATALATGLAAAGPPACAVAALPEPTASRSDTVDWAAVEARFKGKRSFVERLARTLLQSLDDTAARLDKALAERDVAALAFIAHSFKGVVGNLLMSDLQREVAEIEAAARAGEPDAPDRAAVLLPAIAALRASTHDYLARVVA